MTSLLENMADTNEVHCGGGIKICSAGGLRTPTGGLEYSFTAYLPSIDSDYSLMGELAFPDGGLAFPEGGLFSTTGT